tara:strand:- start:3837 stop:4295 length:459 start_codon:yes stop_codon:yes gene_type:complete
VKIKIRKTSSKDLDFTFFLRNENVARKNSINSKKITLKNHKIWFKKKINDKNSLYFIVMSKDSQRIGIVRYDLKDIFAYVSINIKNEFRNLGYGSIMLKETEKLIKKNLILVANVKKSNVNSLKIFKKNKYILLKKAKQLILVKIIKKVSID